jgi:hypothetical protein
VERLSGTVEPAPCPSRPRPGPERRCNASIGIAVSPQSLDTRGETVGKFRIQSGYGSCSAALKGGMLKPGLRVVTLTGPGLMSQTVGPMLHPAYQEYVVSVGERPSTGVSLL